MKMRMGMKTGLVEPLIGGLPERPQGLIVKVIWKIYRASVILDDVKKKAGHRGGKRTPGGRKHGRRK